MRLALVGIGMVSEAYIGAIASSGGKLSLRGIYARNADSCEAFSTKIRYQIKESIICYASIEQIANDPEVDAVIIATPPNARQGLAEIFADAGKPILMEKPIERDACAALKIVELCESKNVPLGIMLQQRARSVNQMAHTRLLAGEFGTISFVRIDVPWWRAQSYYDVPGRGSYERDGGGVMISQAIHTIDIALWLAGEIHSVQGFSRTSTLHEMESEDVVAAGLQFKNGAVGSLTATTAAYPGAPENIEIHCTRGSLRLTAGTMRIDWQNGKSETFGEKTGTGSGVDPMAFPCDLHLAVLMDFANVLQKGSKPMITGREAMRVHNLIDAITISSKEGRSVLLENLYAPQ